MLSEYWCITALPPSGRNQNAVADSLSASYKYQHIPPPKHNNKMMRITNPHGKLTRIANPLQRSDYLPNSHDCKSATS